jgi:hypothetical protein
MFTDMCRDTFSAILSLPFYLCHASIFVFIALPDFREFLVFRHSAKHVKQSPAEMQEAMHVKHGYFATTSDIFYFEIFRDILSPQKVRSHFSIRLPVLEIQCNM